jgi:hypothetical protein
MEKTHGGSMESNLTSTPEAKKTLIREWLFGGAN